MPSFDVEAIDLAQLRTRLSVKYQYFDADVIPSWVAEMDFPLAAPIAEALHAAIDRSDTGYRSALGMADAFVDFAAREWQWTVAADRVISLPDVLSGVSQSLLQLTAPGDGVVLTSPVYYPFFSTIGDYCGRTVVDVPLTRLDDGSYDWDLNGLEAAFARPDVTACVLCNPHNPTGNVAPRSTLTAIAALAEEHDVLMVVDEIHAPLTLPGATHIPYLTVADDDANVVVVTSASKAWNLPGLKCAQLIGTSRTAPLLTDRIPMEVIMGAGHLGVIANVAAYREGGVWLQDVRRILDSNRFLVADLLGEHLPRAGYVPPQASYLAWLDLREYDLGADPAAFFLEHARVALSAGPPFGPGGVGHARLNFATSPAILTEIVERLGRVVQ